MDYQICIEYEAPKVQYLKHGDEDLPGLKDLDYVSPISP